MPRANDRPGATMGRTPAAWLAFLLYLIGSVLLFGLPIAGHLGSRFVGQGGPDSRLYVWDLAWWPHALAHGLNPFHPTLVWAPAGVNMAWVTGLPGPALAMAPVTALFGPVVSSNILALLAPALAGWAAYLLCREVAGRWWPAFAGGWLFAFSTYLDAEMRGHMNLFLVFPVPLAAYLAVRHAKGGLSSRAFVLLLGGTLVAQFSISTEVFASVTMFAAIALGGAFAFAPIARDALRRTVPRIGLAYLLAAIPLAPYLWYAVTGAPATSLRPIGGSSVDALSYLVPRAGTLIGGQAMAGYTAAFRANVSEDGAYLGPVLVAVLIWAVVASRRERVTWLIVGFATAAAILSLGGHLDIHGQRTIPMPWLAPAHLPFLGSALPERFTLYVWLALAVLVARWLAALPPVRWQVATASFAVVVAALMVLPNTWMEDMHRPAVTPAFFTANRFAARLRPGETVLIVHRDAQRGDEMLWQAAADFDFAMAQGHTGPQPALYASDPLWQTVAAGGLYGFTADQLRSWLHDHGVSAVLVTPDVLSKWRFLLAPISGSPRLAGGIWTYRPTGGASTY